MCSSTGLLGAVTESTWALMPRWYSVIVHSMSKTWQWSTLWGVPKNTSAGLPGLCMVIASIFMGDGTHKFCTRGHAILCRLAGMKLDKGSLLMGKPPEAEGGTCMHHVCVGSF